ncbi:head-tail connector protein [Neomegalonema sp.]|uniref:head-tail connector protein n=1 Tax=Neomegalonema sp. TaxID=2039713 RepID=UPI0026037175|nr:head-tail connector protein [Neomegalonema sp.]MDD2870233.1 head-tail connector protein [Neomegalonema sp.]
MSWSALRRIAPAPESALEALAPLQTLRDQIRIADDFDDATLKRHRAAAFGHLSGPEGVIGIALAPETWRMTLPGFPTRLRIPLGPVQSVVSVSCRTPEGGVETLPPETWRAALDLDPAELIGVWPQTQPAPDAVRVDFVAGFAPEDFPEAIRQAIHLLVGHWDRYREAGAQDAVKKIPHGVFDLIAPYRRGVVA